MGIYGDIDPDYSAEELEYEFHRLMSIAEAYTGAEALRQRLPQGVTERVAMVMKFIQEEEALRQPFRTPHTIEDQKKAIQRAADKDDFYEWL